MKNIFTKLFFPILNFFETDEEPTNYKESHRVVLNIIGSVSIILSIGAVWSGYVIGEIASVFPAVVFLTIGVIALVVGTLGSNGAVARIWSRK